MPQSDLPDFLRWRDDTIRPEGKTPEEVEAKRQAAGHAINEYFIKALEEKRKNPDDRLITKIEYGEVDGRPLTQAEKLGICHLLLLGGLDTVTATLDCMIAYLAQHPDRRQAVVDNPELMAPAIEEMLRQQTPVMMVPRIIAQDYELGGVQMTRGRRRDAADRRRQRRRVAVRVVATKCCSTGSRTVTSRSAAARTVASARTSRGMELRVALEEFHKRIPEYEIAEGTELHFSPGIRQAENLPLVFPVKS